MSIITDRNIAGGSAKPKIMISFGVNQFYKYYKQNKGPLDKGAFGAIIRECNKIVMEEVLRDAEEYTLPHGIGRISFRKRKNKAFIPKSGGKIKTNALVDWKKTMEHWIDNPLARRNKIRIRYNNMHTGRYSMRISMFNRKLHNKEYFAFQYKRGFKRKFAERIFTYNKDKIEVQITKTI